MISHAKFSLPIPVEDWQQEIAALPEAWTPHFNYKHYSGDWSVLSLRSPGGEETSVLPDLILHKNFADTPLMKTCPSIRNWLELLQCEKMAVRLLNLKNGSCINEHRDHELSFEQGEARLHIPVFTNPQVIFHINKIPLQMKEGECWYINANLPHAVENNGATDRIHLVVDCKVNEWLKAMMKNASCYLGTENQSLADAKKIIAELRLQNTLTSNRLANELEMQANK